MKSGFMPPTARKLSAAELETIRKWIVEGARRPKDARFVGENPFAEEGGARRLPR